MTTTDIMKKLVDQTGKKVQCSYDKGEKSSYRCVEEALQTPFIRFGNSFFLPAISLDIDDHKNHAAVLNVCIINEIPLPNAILDTSKGLHVHWVFNKPISTKNKKALYKYQLIISRLVEVFGTDVNAVPKNSGRMFRNLLKHTVRLYNNDFIDLNNFTHLIKTHKSITKRQEKITKKSSQYKKPDFSKVTEGARNGVLFDYGRNYAYRRSSSTNLKEILNKSLIEKNNTFNKPLSNCEVANITSSILSFMAKKYKGTTNNSNTLKFNRSLAKAEYDKKHKQMLDKYFQLTNITPTELEKLSLRKGSTLLGVHKNTYKSHLQDLLNDIRLLSNAPQRNWEVSPTFIGPFLHNCVTTFKN